MAPGLGPARARAPKVSVYFPYILRYPGPQGEQTCIFDGGSWGVTSEQVPEGSKGGLENYRAAKRVNAGEALDQAPKLNPSLGAQLLLNYFHQQYPLTFRTDSVPVSRFLKTGSFFKDFNKSTLNIKQLGVRFHVESISDRFTVVRALYLSISGRFSKTSGFFMKMSIGADQLEIVAHVLERILRQEAALRLPQCAADVDVLARLGRNPGKSENYR